MRGWLVLALALLGCDAVRTRVDPCEASLTALEDRLEAAARSAPPYDAPTEVALPRSAHGVPLEGAPPLLVVGEEVVFRTRGVGGGEDVDRTAGTLRSDVQSWMRSMDLADADAVPIALWAEPAGSADALARLLRHAPPNARFALLVRGAALAPLEGEPAWVESTVRAPEGRPEAQRQRFAVAWRRATETCAGARSQMPAPASLRQGGPSLGAPSVTGLMSALTACGCARTDLAAIEAVARRALVDPEGPVHRLPATLRFGAPTDDAAAIEVRDGETVEALVARIGGRTGTLWVRAD